MSDPPSSQQVHRVRAQLPTSLTHLDRDVTKSSWSWGLGVGRYVDPRRPSPASAATHVGPIMKLLVQSDQGLANTRVGKGMARPAHDHEFAGRPGMGEFPRRGEQGAKIEAAMYHHARDRG